MEETLTNNTRLGYNLHCIVPVISIDFVVNSFGDMSRKELKSGKVYYICKFANRFQCGFKLRTFPHGESSNVRVETSGEGHDHSRMKEKFSRGLSNHVKAAIGDILQYNTDMRPSIVLEKLLNPPHSFPAEDVLL